MASVTLTSVGKKFGDVSAVRDLDLAIRDGEFMALLGPSGCGKTTTLNMIAGLELPTGGTIRIGERDVSQLPAMHRDIAMVFQSYALYPHMTVARNMGFALKVRGYDKAEIDRRVARAAEMLALGPYLDRHPRQLSGGQRQRVALGRALVRDPQVFLLDEPLSNLDAVLRVQTRAELSRLFKTLATTAVYVTHDQAEAMTMADRIAVFSAGQLQQVGEPLDIYRAPANKFVASFVGNPPMSFLDGQWTDGGEIACGALRLAGPARVAGLRPGDTITVGLRPEDIELGGEGIEAVADVVEHLGSLQIVYLSVGGQQLVVQTAEGRTHRRGDRLRARVDPAKLYLFSPETGAAIYAPGRLGYSTQSNLETAP
ncbi:MAG: ABC transporter ATP-binding protein [Devosia sp.]|nr:ABC transporter ATP-binding protein [Devosia sp.]